MKGDTERQAGPTDSALVPYRFDMFAVSWAAATLFHMAGDRRPPWVPSSPLWAAVVIGLGVAAAAVLFGWKRRTALVILCVLVPFSAWLEAPVVGNHWVLAAAMSLAAVGAAALVRLRGTSSPDESFWAIFAPVARCSLLIAYAFAAFAKLNTSFFDPSVSCAVFYQDQLVRSWGLGALSVSGQPGLGTLVAVGAALTELSVAVLLLLPKTRRAGVLLAMGFHWVLALDLSQHFWDFSSVLFAGFLLFLDGAVVEQMRQRLAKIGGAIRPQVRNVLVGLAVVVCAVITVGAVVPFAGLLVVVGHGAWIIGGTGILVVVALAVFRAPPIASPGGSVSLRVRPALLLVPALVLFNGLTPYLEFKTGFGWNMYSNLRTVAGDTNHFLVPSTLDVTGLQSDRVTIVDASDEAVSGLVGSDYELVYSEFREYAHAFPEESMTYVRDGQTVSVEQLKDDPAAEGGVSPISARLQSFRVVDASGAERCQAIFSPAR